MKEKYGDQDEEDRLAAMELLHGSSNKKTGRKAKKGQTQTPSSKPQRGAKKVKDEKNGNTFQRADVELARVEHIPILKN